MLKGVNFIPVLNGSILNCALRDDMFIGNKRLTFYTKDSLFNYNKFLINPFHHSKIFEEIKNRELIPDDAIAFADSGGLQEITLNEVRYSPDEVFRWQQDNTNIGFSVDCLPFITPKDGTNKPGSFGGWHFDKANFINCAKKSKDNIDVTKRFRARNDFKFYGIIQGRQYSEYLQWYEVIRDDYLDGYCVKAPNTHPLSIAETMIFAMENINKPVHFLGVGNLSRSIIIYYAAKHMKQAISYDSSSYDIGVQYRSFLLPFLPNKKLRFVSNHNLGEDNEIINQDDVVHIDDVTELCDCIACRAIGNETKMMIKTNDPRLGSILSLHNLLLNLKLINYTKTVIDKPVKLREFVEGTFEQSLSQKILNGFEMIDLAVEKGYDYAVSKFKDRMVMNKNGGEQRGVFDF